MKTKKILAIKYKDEISESKEEEVIIDSKIKILINEDIERSFTVLYSDLKEFTIGYLLGEGFVESLEDIEEIAIDDKTIKVKADLKDLDFKNNLILTSDKSGGLKLKTDEIKTVKSNLKVSSKEILNNLIRLKDNAEIWQKTGGCHIAGIVNNNKIITCEDVSRHVALDKVIGLASLKKIDLNNSYIVYSGRMPADMMIKVSRMNIPIVASNAAPMLSGYEVAKKANITMLGFVRGNRFNLYTGKERIILE